MNNTLDFDIILNSDDYAKVLLLRSYFAAKADESLRNFKTAVGSRAKDEESFRWRFANNEVLFFETPLIEHIAAKKKDDKSAKALKEHKADLSRIEKEKAEILGYEITLYDLKVDSAEQVAAIFNSLDEQTKKKLVAAFEKGLKDFDVNLIKVPSQMGE